MVAVQCAGAEASFGADVFGRSTTLPSESGHNTPGDSAAIAAPRSKQCNREK
jgi:hypothetical protein